MVDQFGLVAAGKKFVVIASEQNPARAFLLIDKQSDFLPSCRPAIVDAAPSSGFAQCDGARAFTLKSNG
ncbi:hypothetical protein [Paraburkholderia dinghuensis]|uniref:Uncharacterized protein n=1 Tax=Paraburkholderia dinghuensis TaxID=2305225 RepID=A0A3N6PQQ0_9BURK|nr:hypothetical protein [Paraburkholderia dinghuensis]RQH01656.1 hypothetical protein D1Y85_23095 [Paraburkholderia dinghuensis]